MSLDLALSPLDRAMVLRFASAFLWADLDVAPAERLFFSELAHELDLTDEDEIEDLLESPPLPEDVDPGAVGPRTAAIVRAVVLRAIAADGRIDRAEMTMFDLLDELLPRENSV